ncbi:MAG: hypothetical protein L6R39_000882 [Caloplaca ligustica]|nr:MAG: hypothetical protein L6R39_000882 [Caloplaca ligustica]
MATTMVNGMTNADGNSTNNNTITGPGKQQTKANLGPKGGDGPRKPAGSSSDSSQRKPAPPKAWQGGMNPITQRSTTPASQNGSIPQSRAGPQNPAPTMDVADADKHAHDRLLFLMTHFIGLSATITVKSGEVFSGIFFGASLEGSDRGYLLKMVHKIRSADKAEANGSTETNGEFIGSGEDYAMSFDTKDVVHLAVDGVTFDVRDKAQNGQAGGFRTDADISGNLTLRERNLQRWEPSADTETNISLEGPGGAWDQFQANEQRFGLKSDYDENIYTTIIDKSHPDYRRREAEALRIAQEIEGGQADNAHVREERGINNPEDALDEEQKYSGVRRHPADYPPLHSNQANRYTPPARRPPTGKPTVAGAPVDPAIISLQMAGADTDKVEKQPAAKEVQNGAASPTIKPEVASEAEKEVPKAAASNKEASSSTPRQLAPIKTSKVRESATATVETELLDSFKQFANNEKMKFHDQRRQRVTHDKAIKLNDLMKFSQNFKLLTPVPKDLVPILAKDKSKQEAIIEKAQRNAGSNTTSAKAVSTASTESKASTLGETARPAQEAAGNRQIVPPQGLQATQAGRERPQQLHNGGATGKTGQGLLSHRLADSHRQHKTGLPPMTIPQSIPIQSVSKAARGSINTNNQLPGASARTPTSASSASAKFNVRAMEFRPNPAANSFRPPGGPSATSSPRSTPHARSASRPTSPSAFFGNRKPLPRGERESITAHFNPVKRLKETAQQEGKPVTDNGGIRRAYTTPPTWNTVGPEEEFKSYKQVFDDTPSISNIASAPHGSPSHPTLPHQHQLPVHLQQAPHAIPQIHASQQASFHSQPQAPQFPMGPHHHDDHRMHLSASSSGVYPSPRMHNASLAYSSPMHQPAHLAYGQPMPQYILGPNGPQPAPFGRQFSGGPQMIPAQGAPLAAPMMVQQSSQGGYMAPPHGMAIPFNPQMSMYPPGQPAGYTPPSQPSTSYPSPNRGAPMMMHQGSHQGQPSQVYVNPGQYGQAVYAQQQPPHMMPMRGYGSPQPHYSQSPQPQYHYPHQPGRAPSGNYGTQPPQGPHQHMPAQQPPPSGPMDGGDEMK